MINFREELLCKLPDVILMQSLGALYVAHVYLKSTYWLVPPLTFDQVGEF